MCFGDHAFQQAIEVIAIDIECFTKILEGAVDMSGRKSTQHTVKLPEASSSARFQIVIANPKEISAALARAERETNLALM
jgi:hypothetical protein